MSKFIGSLWPPSGRGHGFKNLPPQLQKLRLRKMQMKWPASGCPFNNIFDFITSGDLSLKKPQLSIFILGWPLESYSNFFCPKQSTCFASQKVLPGFFLWFLYFFILSQKKSPYGWGIPVSQREREMWCDGRSRRKKTKNHFTKAGIQTYDLSLLSRALYPLYLGALPELLKLEFFSKMFLLKLK